MSGEAIYAALVSARGSSASNTNIALPTATAAPIDYGGDKQGVNIYNALLAAAQARGDTTAPSLASSVSPSPSLLAAHIPDVQLATVSSSTTTLPSTTGFFTDRLQSLPSALTAVLGVIALLLALGTLGGGARSMLVGSQWGRERGTIKRKAHLGGGVGGVVFGGTAVGAFAALLILVIVGRQGIPTLGAYGTLAIVLCSSILGAFLGGRFRLAARSSCALLASLSLTLLLTSSFHISALLPRLILLAILTPSFLLLAFLPRAVHSLSIFSALTGAYLLIIAIDLFVHLGFVDAMGLLVARNGVSSQGVASEVVVEWGTTGGKGLIAGWWLCAIIGGAWQWWLGGENGEVDETWNSYLSSFITTNPSPLGTYSPPRSFLSRLFSPNPNNNRSSLTSLPANRRRSPWDEDDEEKGHGMETSDAWDSDLEGVGIKERGVSKPARYKAEQESDSEDEEEGMGDVKQGLWSPGMRDEEMSAGMQQRQYGGGMRPESVSSGSTMVGGTGSVGKNLMAEKKDRARKGELTDSDCSDDDDEDRGGWKNLSSRAHVDEVDEEVAHLVSSLPSIPSSTPRRTDKKSSFRSLFSRSSSKPASYRGAPLLSPPSLSHSHSHHPTSPLASNPSPSDESAPGSTPKHAVPATPSLINALHRVQQAQQQARNANTAPSPTSPRPRAPSGGTSDGAGRARKASYDEWWKEVVAKSGK